MMVAETRAAAVTVLKACPEPRLRIFCVPYAGAGASAFRAWAGALPADLELISLQPPGRDRRISEPLSTSLSETVAGLVSDIVDLLDVPFAFFGHSMGALMAFEAARELRRRALPGPVHVIVSGIRAPRTPRRTPQLHRLPDAELVAELRRGGGPPPAGGGRETSAEFTARRFAGGHLYPVTNPAALIDALRTTLARYPRVPA